MAGVKALFLRILKNARPSHIAVLVVALTLVATLSSRACSRKRNPPPERINVILVSVDALRADRLNCYGYTRRPTSPAIDALAHDGVLFEKCITAAPWTTPSHLSLMTSLLPSHHGVVPSFADLLRAFSGRNAFPRLASEHVTLAEALAESGRDTAAFTGGAMVDPRLGFDQGFALYDTSMIKLSPRNTREMLDWIEARGRRPFFLFWHTFEVHAPYLETRFLHEALPPEPTRRLSWKLSRIARRIRQMNIAYGVEAAIRAHKQNNAFNRDVCCALYDGGIRSFDRYFADLVAFLREHDVYDDTLIVLTSDHGEELGDRDRGFYDRHGLSLFDEMVHVPLIVKLPRQAHAGKRIPALISSLDVMPTILDLVRAAPPEAMDGESLRPLWEKGTSRTDRLVINEALWKGAEQKAIRTERHKLILTIGEEDVARHGRRHIPRNVMGRELFDLDDDPRERTDRLGREAPDAADLSMANALDEALRARHGERTARTEETELDQDVIERLRALGYAE
ncbi:MAG: sulfatase [Vicinamibacteria bacterium]|nr:sulfatase [Vicinamibacteria bacterium]